ncbi:metallophosphoesterase family protein [Liberibacter crescens]|uniref:metallophosphoesterase family protein n=1 Tax=Liberibacter crescens TaxID=1273132 RepID=UPI000762F9AE|nr:metallophosphoesterase [Liberibacter crescens]AMC13123.1 metallophosphatase [Liberibacter crescens]
MFILAHISDIHLNVSPSLSFSELSVKRITGLLNLKLNRKRYLSNKSVAALLNDIKLKEAHHLAITGDLVNLTSKKEIIYAQHWLENIGSPHNISVVPGNHDIYTRKAFAKAMKAWNPYIIGDISQKEDPLFPYLRVRGNIALIGCSTAIKTPPFSANGYFSQTQTKKTIELLRATHEAGFFRIIMMHHPPIFNETPIHKRMFGIHRFVDIILKEGTELILHGHTHINSINWLQGPKTPIPVVGIASASQRIKNKKPQGGYNLFYIEGNRGNWKIRGERHSLQSDGVSIYKECADIFLKT